MDSLAGSMNNAAATTAVTLGRSSFADPIGVTLIRGPWVTLLNSGYLMPTPPIGLAYIAAALREAGHRVQVIDAPGEAMHEAEEFDVLPGRVRRIGLTPAQVVDRIDPASRFIGITNMFVHEWPTVREIAELARARFPSVPVVIGGENATAFWSWMFEQTSSIDAVVLGEGERATLEMASRIANGEGLTGIEGVVVREGADGSPESTGLPTRIKDLSSVPRPAWDLFPMQEYFDHKGATGVDRGRSIPILATRGCPYKCSFCSSPNMWTTRYTVRDPIDIIDEIESYVTTYGIRNVDFVDLTPMTKRSWILRLCDELEARNLKVSLQLPIGTRSEALDEEVLRRMAAAGTTNITFAPETGSKRMLEVFDKRLDLDHLLESISAASRAGMVTNIHMILGHPAEERKDRWLNWLFLLRAARAGLDIAGATLFYPYPGSRDFRELVESGKLVVNDDYCYDGLTRGGGGSIDWNPTVTQERLHQIQLAQVLTFAAVSHVLHPSQMVHLVRHVLFGGEERTWLEQGIRTKRQGPMSKARRGLPAVSHVAPAPEPSAAEPSARPTADAI